MQISPCCKSKIFSILSQLVTIDKYITINIYITISNNEKLSTCPAKNQAGCIERVVHHSHENQKSYLFKIVINEKCQKPKLKVKAITVAMATAV